MKLGYLFSGCILIVTVQGSTLLRQTHPQETHLNMTGARPDFRPTGRAAAPCARNDSNCWCKKATDYTNNVRRKHGIKKMLKVGTESQLANAKRYAEKLAREGKLQHQSLQEATKEVGCQRWIGGENLAYNGAQGDFAKTCVEQWVGSKGHFANLIRDWFDEVVVGFHIDRFGRVFCVQTFAVQNAHGTFGKTTDRGCQPVGGQPRPSDTNEKDSRAGNNPERGQKAENGSGSEGNMVGSQSCKCLSKGKGCWRNLASQTGGKCRAGVSLKRQSSACKKQCCDYCSELGNKKRCAEARIKATCRRG